MAVFLSKVPPPFQLEYRRPNRKPSEAIAEDGIRLKFCPWRGRNLLEQSGLGPLPFRTQSAEESGFLLINVSALSETSPWYQPPSHKPTSPNPDWAPSTPAN